MAGIGAVDHFINKNYMTITITPATLESNIQKRFYFWKFGTACVLVPDVLFFHMLPF
jgi:hypothetical protein